MRRKVVALIGCFAPLTGCTTYKLVGHNVVHEVVQYEDDQKIRHRLRTDAERLWQTIAAEYPRRTFSREFRDGFVDGYADYLDSGGTAGPPLVPPVRYRRSKYFCPEGQALVRDYFAGFKYGTEVACATGQRQFLTVPVLLPVEKPDPPLSISVSESTKPTMPPPPPLPSEEGAETIPPPGIPLDAPMPVPAVPPVPDAGPRNDMPKATPPAPAGPAVPSVGKIRPASAVEPVAPPTFGEPPVPDAPAFLRPVPE